MNDEYDYEYEELSYRLGISKELSESPYIEARIYNDPSEYGWYIQIHPSLKSDRLYYFKIYNKKRDVFDGIFGIHTSTKCARISILSPEYIRCTDSSKDEWFLNNDEKRHLCDILDIQEGLYWNDILYSYEEEIKFNTDKSIQLQGLSKPDYMQLPE